MPAGAAKRAQDGAAAQPESAFSNVHKTDFSGELYRHILHKVNDADQIFSCSVYKYTLASLYRCDG